MISLQAVEERENLVAVVCKGETVFMNSNSARFVAQRLMAGAALVALAQPAITYAQDTAAAESEVDPEQAAIVVEGIRATQRSSLEEKRSADMIVDALVSDEIGALPDQSVGETLERIVGVSADRFKGSASEISVRGLGPFLGFSTLNGREVTSGSGDRAVSFQQFPSELVSGVLVYKSQNAELIEGGTSGVVELRTLRPLDFGRSRIQVDLRGIYEPYDDKIDGRDGFGYRAAASIVRQFAVGDGEMGFALGWSKGDEATAEDFYTESSTVQPCNSVAASATTGTNCSVMTTGGVPNTGQPIYFVPNQYLWRQMNNSLTRDAVMGTWQYQPRPELDINVDIQYSNRNWVESRTDLVIAEGRRGVIPTEIADNGALIGFTANSRLESQTRIRERDEDYYGGGLALKWMNDAARVGLDVSYSRTQRDQFDRQTRLRTDGTRAFNINGTPVNFTLGRVPYSIDKSSGEPVLTFPTLANGSAFDINDHSLFTDAAFARRDSESRVDEIFAVRLDGEAFIENGFLRSIQGGLRYSNHGRIADLENQNRIEAFSDAAEAAANQACRVEFRDPNFLKDGTSNVKSWATFDPLCMFTSLTGSEDTGPAADPRSIGDINVTEKIMAGYAMVNFGSEDDRFGGNLGVRILNTNVRSEGLRGAFTASVVNDSIVLTPTGDFDSVTIKNDFWNFLPSLNLKYLVSDEFLVRGALYRALSRPNIEDMRAGRDIVTDNTGNATIADAISGVSGGNPRLEPLLSWNADLSFEYYANADNAITLALFYKQLQAGIVAAEASSVLETFIIDGVPVTVPVAQQTNDNQKRDLWGLELTVNHAMTYLPGPLDGLGVIAGYSYAGTNFEYPDPSAVDPNFPLALFTEPASIIGLSKHTLNATAYYEKGPISLRLLYKFRSRYLKPFELNANRFAQGSERLDANITFRVNRQVQIRLDALNLLNEPQYLERPVPGAVSEISYYGTRYQAGVRFRF